MALPPTVSTYPEREDGRWNQACAKIISRKKMPYFARRLPLLR
jgi:hypothetical protein